MGFKAGGGFLSLGGGTLVGSVDQNAGTFSVNSVLTSKAANALQMFSAAGANLYLGTGSFGTSCFALTSADGFLTAQNNNGLAWSSDATSFGTRDLFLRRGGAGILEQRNGVNPQFYSQYATYTDASNWERLHLGYVGGVIAANTTGLGTGANRTFRFNIGGVAYDFTAAGNAQFPGLNINTPTGSLGFMTGTGGAVSQITSKATGVTLNKSNGQITMNNAALLAAAKVSFVVSNTQCAATDVVDCCVASGGTANAYRASVTAVAANSFTVTVENITAGSLSEAPVITFVILKAVTS